MTNVVLAIIIPVLQVLFAALTPAIRELLTVYLREVMSKALATPSPWDDFAIRLLCAIVGVSTDGVVPAQPPPGVTPMTMPVPVAKAIMSANFSVVSGSGGGTVTDPMTIPGMQGQ